MSVDHHGAPWASSHPVPRLSRLRRTIPVLAATVALTIALPLPATIAKQPPERAPEAKPANPGGKPSAQPSPTPSPSVALTPSPSVAPTPTPTATSTSTPPTGPTYYVAPTGSDTASGTWSAPWATIQHAANTAAAGSTIQVRGGSYAPVTITRSGLTFEAYGTETVTVNATVALPNAIRISGASDITIRRFIAQNGPSQWGAGIRIERGASRVAVTGSILRNNRSFGVVIESSNEITISDNEITRNETGVQVSYQGSGVRITGNTIHTNDRMIVNDSTAWNDRGANGVVFYRTTGPVTVSDNVIHGNRATSIDYGYDGGAFEIYAASGITMTGNTLYNNQMVVETGTDGAACSNITFTRNVAYGGADGGLPSQGLILRCMSSSLIANNTFSDLSDFVYYVTSSGGFAGSLSDLKVQNNIARQPDSKAYSFGNLVAGVTFNHNVVHNAAGTSIAWVNGYGNTPSLATLRTWTGYETNGVQGDPLFADGAFRLSGGSPAIDEGVVISGVTDGARGAPDIGRWEW